MKYQIFIAFLVGATILFSVASAEENRFIMQSIPDCVETKTITSEGTWYNLDCNWKAFDPVEIGPEKEVTTKTTVISGSTGADDVVTIVTDYTPDEEIIGPVQEVGCLLSDALCDLEDKKRQVTNIVCNGKQDLSDIEACMLWQSAVRPCWRGEDESAPIQNNEPFWMSIGIPDDTKSWTYSSAVFLEQIKAKSQECIGQNTYLEPIILGPEYLSKPAAGEVYSPYHGENVVALKALEDSGVIFDTSVTQEDIDSEAEDAYNEMLCELAQFQGRLSKDQNCVEEKHEGPYLTKKTLEGIRLEQYKERFNLYMAGDWSQGLPQVSKDIHIDGFGGGNFTFSSEGPLIFGDNVDSGELNTGED